MRLIDQNELINKFQGNLAYMGKDVVDKSRCVQTIDAVPVVRCKDCKHWDYGDCYRLELSHPDDFCSYGERMDKEDEHEAD